MRSQIKNNNGNETEKRTRTKFKSRTISNHTRTKTRTKRIPTKESFLVEKVSKHSIRNTIHYV